MGFKAKNVVLSYREWVVFGGSDGFGKRDWIGEYKDCFLYINRGENFIKR